MENNNRQELTERFVSVAEFLNRQFHLRRLDEWESLDMTIPQIKTLILLERMGPMRMGSISTYLERALSATTTVVDRLVEKNLVDRSSDPEDRRVVLCELTDTGREAISRFWRIGSDRIQLVADSLDTQQLETVVQGLELIRWAEQQAQEDASVSEQGED